MLCIRPASLRLGMLPRRFRSLLKDMRNPATGRAPLEARSVAPDGAPDEPAAADLGKARADEEQQRRGDDARRPLEGLLRWRGSVRGGGSVRRRHLL